MKRADFLEGMCMILTHREKWPPNDRKDFDEYWLPVKDAIEAKERVNWQEEATFISRMINHLRIANPWGINPFKD